MEWCQMLDSCILINYKQEESNLQHMGQIESSLQQMERVSYNSQDMVGAEFETSTGADLGFREKLGPSDADTRRSFSHDPFCRLSVALCIQLCRGEEAAIIESVIVILRRTNL